MSLNSIRTGVIRLVFASLTVVGLAVIPAPAAQAAPSSGYNDWSCKPSSAHPEPVVLMHGLGASGDLNFALLGPTLKSAGYCVYSFTYGSTDYSEFVGGLDSMPTSAGETAVFVDKVLAATGAARVSMVGHSEGTTVSAYYIKFNGGAAKVKRWVGFGSNLAGTTLNGLTTLSDLLGLGPVLTAGGCPACAEFSVNSPFFQELNGTGGLAVDGPTYTSIMSRYDEIVTPYTSGRLPVRANTKNIVLQDRCGWDFSGHLGVAWSPNVAKIIKNELDPANARNFWCVPIPWLG